MGITSFGASGGKYDELFKKSLVPFEKWKDDSAWTKDAGLRVASNNIELIPKTISDLTANTSQNATRSLDNTIIWAQTFTIGTSNYITELELYIYHESLYRPNADINIKITPLDGNGNPDINNPLGEGKITKDQYKGNDTSTYIASAISKVPYIASGVKHAFVLETKSTESWYPRADATTTDTYTGGNVITSTDGGTTWSSNATMDLHFTIRGGSDVPTSAGAYVDIDMTGEVAQLSNLSFTKDTDGTNGASFDILDTNNNLIKGDITSDTSLSDLELNKVRIKATLDMNGSSNVPRLSSYSLNQYLKGYETKRNLKVTDGLMKTSGPTDFKEALNIQGSCKLYVASALYDHSTYKNAQIEVHVDGSLLFKSYSDSAGSPPTLLTRDFLKIVGGTDNSYKVPSRNGYQTQYHNYALTTPLPYTANELYKWKWVMEPIECKESLVVKIASYSQSYGTNFYIVTEV